MKSAVNVNMKWSGFSEYCTSWMIRENNLEFCDLTLVCDDGEKLNAHQIILVNSSSVLRSMLNNNKHPNPIIYLKGVKLTTLSSVLDFIYRGETSLSHDDLQRFLDLSENLCIKGMNDITNPIIFEENNYTALRKTPLESKDVDIDQDLFSVVSKLERKLENKITIKKESKYTKNTSEYSENPKFSCSMEETDVEIKVLSMLEILDKIESAGTFKRYSCSVCKLASKDKSDFMKHAEKHIDELSYTCFLCNHTTKTKCNMKAHISKNNCINTNLVLGTEPLDKETKSYTCSLDKSYVETQVLSMIERQEEMETKLKIYKCNVCQKACRDRNDCMKHVEKHIDGLNFTCLQCLFNSVSRCSMNAHILKHEGIKQGNLVGTEDDTYSVNMDKDKLEEQITSMMEKGEKWKHGHKWSCNICGKISSEKAQGVAHVENHIPGLVYSCPHCDNTTMNRYAMKVHMNKTHPVFNNIQ